MISSRFPIMREPAVSGFTLIELSIVLVIIGLIVGGVLVGQSLVSAATLRAQITQIEKFNQAANTFFGKYGALPGDIAQGAVTQFGFTASPTRAGTAGSGDGNGELDGSHDAIADSWNLSGENLFFWEDLSTNSHLIEGGFNSASGIYGNLQGTQGCTSIAACTAYYPVAKVGSGAAFVYTYSGYAANCCTQTGTGPNFFGLSVLNSVADFGNTSPGSAPALTVAQAYAIDTKMDDGLPMTGNVLAQYLTSASLGQQGWSTNAASASATTCYDTSSGTAKYSTSYQNGALVNCGLSFKMQAGD